MPSMRVSLPGVFGNVKAALKKGDRKNADYLGFALDEIEKHLRETVAGQHTLQEFAEHYCLAEEQRVAS